MSEKIQMRNNKLIVPDNPIIPYIEGDGIGIIPGANINFENMEK